MSCALAKLKINNARKKKVVFKKVDFIGSLGVNLEVFENRTRLKFSYSDVFKCAKKNNRFKFRYQSSYKQNYLQFSV